MKPPYFNVRAICGNSRCETSVFEKSRKKAHYESADGHTHQVERVVCPGCRMWAKVTNVKEVTE